MDEELDSPHANFEFGARLHRAVVRAAAPGGLLDTLGTLRFAPLGEIALYVAAACGATAAASVSLRAKRGNRFLLAAVFLAWCGVTMGFVRELRAFSAPTHARGTRAWAIEVLAARAVGRSELCRGFHHRGRDLRSHWNGPGAGSMGR